MIFDALKLWERIRQNLVLEELEKEGLCRGEQRGKKPDVSIDVLALAVHKQYRDFVRAYVDDDKKEMKRCLADLRNVAGLVFLKLEDEEAEACPDRKEA